jgi:hypothetical protein
VITLATAFETAVDAAGDQVTGYVTTALPIVALVTASFLAIKYARRFIKGM